MPFVSFIVGFKNRDTDRVKLFLDSLNKQSDKDFELIFVDYGSEENLSEEVRKISAGYSFSNYVFFNARGQNWNRSKCLNHGYSKSSGEYVFTADIDFLFKNDFVTTLKEIGSVTTAKYFKVGFLTEDQSRSVNGASSDYKIESYSDTNAIGALFISRVMFDQLGGYDEYFELWGLEDNDFLHRVKLSGNHISFYDKEILVWHIWHLPIKKSNTLPDGWLKFLTDYFNHKKNSITKPNQNYYCHFDPSRPILTDKTPLKYKQLTFQYNGEFIRQLLGEELKKTVADGVLEIKFDFSAFQQHKESRLNKLVAKVNSFISHRGWPLVLLNKNMYSFLCEKEARETLLYFIKNNAALIKDYYLPDDLTINSFYLMKK